MSGSRGGKESLDLKQTDRRNGGSRRLDADATAEVRQADWKPSAKLSNPHWPGPVLQSSPGDWQQDTPDVCPHSYWSPGAQGTSSLEHLQHRFFFFFWAHKNLSDGLWQLVEVPVKPQTRIRIRVKFSSQQMAITLLHTDRRESLPAVY